MHNNVWQQHGLSSQSIVAFGMLVAAVSYNIMTINLRNVLCMKKSLVYKHTHYYSTFIHHHVFNYSIYYIHRIVQGNKEKYFKVLA